MSTSKTHIAKQEELVDETAVQLRTDDPVSPVDGQLWLNTTQNRLKLKKDSDIKILLEGHIGAAALLQADGIMNANVSRSYYKDTSAPITINAIANLVEGVTLYLRVNNPSAKVKAVYAFTAIPSEDLPDGSYFYVNSAVDLDRYYVWFNKDGLGLATPVVAGRTAVPVVYTKGRKQKSNVVCSAGSSFSGGAGGGADFIQLNSPTTGYYAWFNLDSSGGNPTAANTGRTAIQVAILSSDTAAQVASKLAAALNGATGTPFAATTSGGQVVVENSAIGAAASTTETAAGISSVSTLTVGAAPDTSTQIAVKIAAALVATTKFTAPVPTTPTAVITAVDFGYATPPSDLNTGMSILVTTPGSGKFIITFPTSFFLDDANPVGFVEGQEAAMFRFFRSGAFVLVTTSKFPLA